MLSTEELLRTIRGSISIGEPMSEHTSLKIGGSADFFIDPLDRDDFCEALRFFSRHNLPCTIIGRGSNMLVHDDGIRGAVIRTPRALGKLTVKKESVVVEAGVPLPLLAEKTFAASLGGIELLQGIPGTTGGALMMNAGAWGQELFDVVSWVEVLRDGTLMTLQREEIRFGYRYGGLDDSVIISAGLKLKKLSAASVRERLVVLQESRKKRMESQPLSQPNAGSIFRNPDPVGHPEAMSAGKMIDLCGLKGTRRGDAVISDVHANFIVNAGSARAADMIELISVARNAVQSTFGVCLDLEIKLLGFENALC
ncbi:UDP-N-acetylenolpyruvoylglucosamine reductase [Prosthecochloris aestuarii DSM 271]|uniref:UDP-N-acetylenolpyruvoylglucosamine reductase n=1 Tax=Prosthecochloris aestuarii (strain DSM 271 / SK 413) TaxID=290512 RepID=B4S6Q7_PROA2|nr:UDP-N-acetylmuramate dehydrogenase [Prosthecochloris aestuarii]ACF47262.1 UDP-N-acetylenolpyruvoylglucosamine reductase [Prosthecochloris aestuarii DSM 271]